MNSCPRCGTEARPEWVYCPRCAMVLDSSGFDPAAFSDRIRYIRREAANRNRRNLFVRSLANISWAVAAILLIGGGVVLFHPGLAPAWFKPTELTLPERPAVQSPEEPSGDTSAVLPFEWVTIPAGEYLSGPPGDGIESRKIYLPAYQILKYEVSNGQWWTYLNQSRKRLETRPGLFAKWVPRNWGWDPESGPQAAYPADEIWEKPVVYVTWAAAQDFCVWWLSSQSDENGPFTGARLPTNHEWEKAARGGLQIPGPDGKLIDNPVPDRAYPWGREFLYIDPLSGAGRLRCNVQETGNGAPVRVREYFKSDVSPYGVVGLGGNVAEFVRTTGSPAYRGGTFYTDGSDARIYLEETEAPGDFTWRFVGFRAARSLPEGE